MSCPAASKAASESPPERFSTRAHRLASGEAATVIGKLDGARVTFFDLLSQGLPNDEIEVRWQPWIVAADGLWVLGKDPCDELDGAAPLEGAFAAAELVEDDPQGPDVGGWANTLVLRAGLLWGHVVGCAEEVLGLSESLGVGAPGEAEIGQLRHPVPLADDDIGGLEVAMDDALAVDEGEGAADLGGDVEGFGEGQGAVALKALVETLTGDEIADDVGKGTCGAEAVNGDDVGMVSDLCGGEGFSLEACPGGLLVRCDDLECEAGAVPVDLKDGAHAPLAEEPDDAVAVDQFTNLREPWGAGMGSWGAQHRRACDRSAVRAALCPGRYGLGRNEGGRDTARA